MGRKQTYEKDAIAKAAFDFLRKAGPEALGARQVARAVGCSTQPLFSLFGSMEGLRAELHARALAVYRAYIAEGLKNPLPFLGSGLAYIRFAKCEPALFRFLFMSEDHNRKYGAGLTEPQDEGAVRDAIGKATGLSGEAAGEMHLCSWIFVHGIAAMLATGTVDYTDEMIESLLHRFFRGVSATFDTENQNHEST